jgi:hypothetical protein
MKKTETTPQAPVEKLASSFGMKPDFVQAAELSTEQINALQAKANFYDKIGKYIVAPAMIVMVATGATGLFAYGEKNDKWPELLKDAFYAAAIVFVAGTFAHDKKMSLKSSISEPANKNLMKSYKQQTLDQ